MTVDPGTPLDGGLARDLPRLPAMEASLTLDSTGRIVLPSEVRKRLRLQPGSRLKLTLVADRIEFTPEAGPAPKLLRRSGRLVLAAGEPLDAAAAIRDERAAQARRRGRR